MIKEDYREAYRIYRIEHREGWLSLHDQLRLMCLSRYARAQAWKSYVMSKRDDPLHIPAPWRYGRIPF